MPRRGRSVGHGKTGVKARSKKSGQEHDDVVSNESVENLLWIFENARLIDLAEKASMEPVVTLHVPVEQLYCAAICIMAEGGHVESVNSLFVLSSICRKTREEVLKKWTTIRTWMFNKDVLMSDNNTLYAGIRSTVHLTRVDMDITSDSMLLYVCDLLKAAQNVNDLSVRCANEMCPFYNLCPATKPHHRYSFKPKHDRILINCIKRLCAKKLRHLKVDLHLFLKEICDKVSHIPGLETLQIGANYMCYPVSGANGNLGHVQNMVSALGRLKSLALTSGLWHKGVLYELHSDHLREIHLGCTVYQPYSTGAYDTARGKPVEGFSEHPPDGRFPGYEDFELSAATPVAEPLASGLTSATVSMTDLVNLGDFVRPLSRIRHLRVCVSANDAGFETDDSVEACVLDQECIESLEFVFEGTRTSAGLYCLRILRILKCVGKGPLSSVSFEGLNYITYRFLAKVRAACPNLTHVGFATCHFTFLTPGVREKDESNAATGGGAGGIDVEKATRTEDIVPIKWDCIRSVELGAFFMTDLDFRALVQFLCMFQGAKRVVLTPDFFMLPSRSSTHSPPVVKMVNEEWEAVYVRINNIYVRKDMTFLDRKAFTFYTTKYLVKNKGFKDLRVSWKETDTRFCG